MTSTWRREQLQLIDASDDLEIAVREDDGTLRRWVPIWAVCVDNDVYVRTWYRRSTGWFGQVLRSSQARIRVPHVLADVTATDVGRGSTSLRARIDTAYRTKYGHRSRDATARMSSDTAAATTLRLTPCTDGPPSVSVPVER